VSFSHSVDGSNVSMQSYEDLGDEDNWDPDRLLELSDLVREAMKATISLCEEHAEILLVVLRAMVQSEQAPNNTANMIDIGVIQDSYFDKLLDDIRHAPDLMMKSKRFQEILRAANVLESKWAKRFRTAYTSLDDIRGDYMLRFGEFRDVTVNIKESEEDGPWVIKNARTIADQEGGLDFTPGE